MDGSAAWGAGDAGARCGVWVTARDGGRRRRGIGVGVSHGDDGYGGA